MLWTISVSGKMTRLTRSIEKWYDVHQFKRMSAKMNAWMSGTGEAPSQTRSLNDPFSSEGLGQERALLNQPMPKYGHLCPKSKVPKLRSRKAQPFVLIFNIKLFKSLKTR